MFKRLFVQSPVPHTKWKFLTLICCVIVIACLKRLNINEKETEDGPLKQTLNVPFRKLNLSRNFF